MAVEEKKLALNLTLPGSYSVDGETRDEDTRETIFILHGYGETKERAIRRFSPALQVPGARLIYVNGLFPVPILKDGEYKEAYAWYFYSVKDQRTIIDPTVCEPLFRRIFELEGAYQRPARVIGYSQGGFLIPFLGQWLPTLRQAIGVSTGYRRDRYPDSLIYRLDAVHGSADTTLEFEKARHDYSQIRDSAPAGEFLTVTAGHRVDAAILHGVRQCLLF